MKPYWNTTDSALSSRNPRFHVESGEEVEIDIETASHTVRWWIRQGDLQRVEAPVEAPAKKTTAKKTTAAK